GGKLPGKDRCKTKADETTIHDNRARPISCEAQQTTLQHQADDTGTSRYIELIRNRRGQTKQTESLWTAQKVSTKGRNAGCCRPRKWNTTDPYLFGPEADWTETIACLYSLPL
ncbi:unnamed protein product, partial [Ectocarpus sp. 12 AP-2014]